MCDHDEVDARREAEGLSKRLRWWPAEELEGAAWQELVWTLRNRDLIDTAIDSYLNTNEEGFDEEALKKVTAGVKRLSEGLSLAMADLYTTQDRLIHEEAIATIRERLETAEAEQRRLEALRVDMERADALRVKWVNMAEGLATFDGADTPTPREQAEIYGRLNVRFQITEPRQEKGDVEVFVPFSNWITVSGVELPSYNAIQEAHHSVGNKYEYLPIPALGHSDQVGELD